MKKRYPKRVNPQTMLTRFEKIFKAVGLKRVCKVFIAFQEKIWYNR